jgi:hypothetical protein
LEKQWCRAPSMYAFSCAVDRPCVRHTAAHSSHASAHNPDAVLPGTRGVSAMRAAALCSGARQHDTHASYAPQHWSFLLQLL